MKKIVSLVLASLLAVSVLFGLVACAPKTDDSNSDLAYVQSKGKLVVGITDFAPMDYQDDNGNWIGFDAEAAKMFADYIGVEVEYFEILDWDTKSMELDAKNIDVVWNGMTLTDEVASLMEVSDTYFNNAQVVIVKADVADQYQTVEACKTLNFAVENGSAGEAAAIANAFNYVDVAAQSDSLMEVKSGTSDAAIIDFLMALATIGEGTDYADLTYTVSLCDEEYTVGFRKGSDMAAKLNEFFSAKATELEALAEKYGIADYLLVK